MKNSGITRIFSIMVFFLILFLSGCNIYAGQTPAATVQPTSLLPSTPTTTPTPGPQEMDITAVKKNYAELDAQDS